jgi:site-specific DNA-cytosine methylase
MPVYYNEWEPFCAQWLRNLIKAGHLPDGEVDERDIRVVAADDIKGFDQCHFFAGIGGWPLALNLAGWGDRPVWTGSCPCQPFSAAGKRTKQSDERHLWPDWYGLIRQHRPATIFGEQVDDAIAAGWIDDAFLDLEGETYACAAAVLPACSVEAPHERQRIFFAAHHIRGQQRDAVPGREQGHQALERTSADGFRPHAKRGHPNGGWLSGAQEMERTWSTADSDKAGHAGRQLEPRIRASEIALNRCSFVEAWQSWNGGFGGFGRLDDGVPKGVAKRVVGGFGNAIVPQVAAEFIKAMMEVSP